MALGRRIKTEHNGPKRGQGAWMRRREAKFASNRIRRRNGRKIIAAQLAA